MEFSRQEYWGGLPRPPLGDLPHPGIEPASLRFPALAGRFFITSATWEKKMIISQVNQISSLWDLDETLGVRWEPTEYAEVSSKSREMTREKTHSLKEHPSLITSHFSDPDGHQSILLRVFWVSLCSLQLQMPNAYQLSYATSIASCSYSYKSGWQQLHYFL